MATVVNYCDILLEATNPRLLPVSLPPNVTVPADSVTGLGDLATQDTVDVSDFAKTIEPVGLAQTLPSPTGYTGPKVVFQISDGKLYRYNGTAWTAVVNTGDLVGTITSTQIGTGAVTTPALAANSVTAAAVAANAIVAGSIAANAVTFGTVAAGAISASQVVAGSLTADRLDTRNLTVKDASGNIILGAGTKLTTANMSGLGSLATQSSVTTSQVTGLGALATLSAVNLATQVTGQLANSSVSGLGALALLNTVNLNTQVSGALNGQTQVTNLGTLAYASSLAANQIGAGTLAAGVIYSGAINANQVNAGTLNGVTMNVGTGHSSSGYALEINSAGVIQVDNMLVGIANFSNQYYTSNTPVVTTSYGDLTALTATARQSSYNCHAIRGQNIAVTASGLVGTASGYAFYAESGTHGPFTGSHDALYPNGVEMTTGDIVIDVECRGRGGLSNTIFEVATSSKPTQKGAIGVIASVGGALSRAQPAALIDHTEEDGTNVMSAEYEAIKDSYSVLTMNALGEGQLNVCGEGGDIEAGDLIVTSSTPGKGMRQSDDVVRGYTVARAREAISFASAAEVGQVACVYLCG
ncbi:hypothetical protein [Paraburkholderia unamae]|uniref:Uncharacterized protein n=1 Tax=Paraburkholderia unamae TaxID=219649 RepID=A0ABX5KTN3_9BURK|nr:hypothetical protein [Paraburkholderia unamae]PVX86484.1 hypothetical protein C7402_102320 [Paraburkholderia unamae]